MEEIDFVKELIKVSKSKDSKAFSWTPWLGGLGIWGCKGVGGVVDVDAADTGEIRGSLYCSSTEGENIVWEGGGGPRGRNSISTVDFPKGLELEELKGGENGIVGVSVEGMVSIVSKGKSTGK